MQAQDAQSNGTMPALLKIAVELGPLVVFFIANAKFGIMVATAIFMVATVTSLSIAYIWERRIAPMPLISGVIVMLFGGLTLLLDDEIFIKLKPTIVNLTFATLLLGGLATGRLLIRLLFGEVINLPDRAWRVLTIRWAVFFVFLAILNEVIWRNFSTDFWVAFKVWGVFPITLLFTASQVPFMAKHQIEDAKPEESRAAE
jgi:intracellular septation protein